MTVSFYCSKKRPRGRPFKPGQSGNPGGKVKKEVAVAIMDMRQMASSYTAEALDKLVQLMRGEVKVGDKVHPVPVHTQGWAAAELIDREGWGPAPRRVWRSRAQNGGPIEVEERTAREYVLGRIAGIRERLLSEGLVIDAAPVEATDSERPD